MGEDHSRCMNTAFAVQVDTFAPGKGYWSLHFLEGNKLTRCLMEVLVGMASEEG